MSVRRVNSSNVNEIFKINYLTTATRKDDLMKRLNLVHQGLSQLEQEVADRQLVGTVAEQLVSGSILKHSDKDVRLLAACCIVDVMRIFAPDAPFRNEQIVEVFEVINIQIRSLANYETGSSTAEKVFYILNSLAEFKSCVVPVILTQDQVPGSYEVMLSMFEGLISSFNAEHGDAGKYFLTYE